MQALPGCLSFSAVLFHPVSSCLFIPWLSLLAFPESASSASGTAVWSMEALIFFQTHFFSRWCGGCTGPHSLPVLISTVCNGFCFAHSTFLFHSPLRKFRIHVNFMLWLFPLGHGTPATIPFISCSVSVSPSSHLFRCSRP